MTNQLPDKPSELLELALSDLAQAERSSKYEVVMSEGHWHTEDGVRLACVARAVMAGTLKVDRFKKRSPDGSETDTEKKLRALDYFRTGDLGLALEFLGIDHPASLTTCVWTTDFHKDRKRFTKNMWFIIKGLKGEGL